MCREKNLENKIKQLQNKIDGLTMKNQEYVRLIKDKETTISELGCRLNKVHKFMNLMERLNIYFKMDGLGN